MRPLFCALVAVAVAGIARADEPKHNTLTPKEIADGWILLFDGETTFGWEAANGTPWRVAEGILAAPADKPDTLVCRTPFREFEVKLEYLATKQSDAKLIVGFNWKEEKRKSFRLDSRSIGWTETKVKVYAEKAGFFIEHKFGGWIGVDGGDGELQPSQFALSGTKVLFRNIKIRPLNTQPLFNGKDLTGWKKYPGDNNRDKTEFSVTKDGFLHLKNGPGDLQTEKPTPISCCKPSAHQRQAPQQRRLLPLHGRRVSERLRGPDPQRLHGRAAEGVHRRGVRSEDARVEGQEEGRSRRPSITAPAAIYRRVPARQGRGEGRRMVHDDRRRARPAHRDVGQRRSGGGLDRQSAARATIRATAAGWRRGAISLQGHDPTTDLIFAIFESRNCLNR